MPSLSELRKPTRRRAIMSWIPISIVALICVGIALGAVAMQNSWWTQANPDPSADQQAPDGTSMFDTAGVDYFTRDGVVRIKIRSDGLDASELGLDADGTETFEPRVPVKAIALGGDGAFYLDLVDSFTLTTAEDRVQSIELVPDGPGTWQSVSSQLQQVGAEWGWTQDQLDQLQTDLGTAAQADDAAGYSAQLPQIESRGALVSANVVVDTDSSAVGLSFTISARP